MSLHPVKFSAILSAALLIAACGRTDDSAPADGADAGAAAEDDPVAGDHDAAAGEGDMEEDLCGAGDYQSLVGANIAAVTLPAELYHRVIGPDDAVTMDHQPTRLNIYTDEDGVITEVSCG